MTPRSPAARRDRQPRRHIESVGCVNAGVSVDRVHTDRRNVGEGLVDENACAGHEQVLVHRPEFTARRLDFPALKRKVIEVYERWAQMQKPILLIEDAGSGTNLIQELYAYDIPAIGIRPEGDKVMRMSAQTSKIEAGAVHLPHHAPWLDDLKSELLAFPLGLHDDQVDSISQALNWMSRPRPRPVFGSL